MRTIILMSCFLILLSVCDNRQPAAQPGNIDIRTGNQSVQSKSPKEDKNISNWKTYDNEKYNYSFQYPDGVKIAEAKKAVFGLMQEDIEAGLAFDDIYTKYTGQICVSIAYGYGGIYISAPPNKDFSYVTCGRTGVGASSDEIIKKEEKIIVQEKEYTATGIEVAYGDKSNLANHYETMRIYLDDGTTIEYGSYPIEGASWKDYLEIKKDLVTIIESYDKSN